MVAHTHLGVLVFPVTGAVIIGGKSGDGTLFVGYHFHEVSMVGVLANSIAVPLTLMGFGIDGISLLAEMVAARPHALLRLSALGGGAAAARYFGIGGWLAGRSAVNRNPACHRCFKCHGRSFQLREMTPSLGHESGGCAPFQNRR